MFKTIMKAVICLTSGFGLAILAGRWLRHGKGLVEPKPWMKDFLKGCPDEFVAFRGEEVLFHTKNADDAQKQWATAGEGSLLFVPIELCRWGMRWER